MEPKFILNVRYNECDMYGHVNHAVYLNYLECARLEFLNSQGISLPDLTTQGYRLFIVKITIDYQASAQYNDQLEIATSVLDLRRVGGTFLQEIFLAGKTVASAEVKWACINSEGKPVRIPEFLTGKLNLSEHT